MSWRRILLFSLVFLVALGSATWLLLQRSDAATKFVRRQLQDLLVGPVSLDSTSIDLAAGRLSATGLRLDDPTRPGQPMLVMQKVQLDVGTNPLGALLSLHGVLLEDVLIDLGPRLPDLASLLRPEVLRTHDSKAEPPAIPPIEMRRGHVRFTPRREVPTIELDDVNLMLTPLEGRPQCAQLTGTAALRELGTTLQLQGNFDLGTGALRILVSLHGVDLDAAVQARLQQLLGIDLGPFDAGGHLRDLTVQCRRSAPNPELPNPPLVFEATAELERVRVQAANLPNLVSNSRITLHATSEGSGTATAHLRQDSALGHLDVTARATGLTTDLQTEVRAKGKSIRVDADVLAALRSFSVGRDVVAALRPTTGQADLDLFLQDPQRPGGLTELDLVLEDVAMSYEGFGDDEHRASFPLPLVQARGRVRLRDDVVLLEDVHASIAPAAGGGDVHLSGRIETKQPGGEDTTLDIQANGVAFSSHLREALTALLHDEGQLYDKLSPEGRTEVAVHIRPRRVLAGGWSVEVRPTAATMQWTGFPLRLTDLHGAVIARADGVAFDLAGNHGSGGLTMRGRIPTGSSPEANGTGFEAVIALQQLNLDDDLRRAVAVLAPEIDAAWQASAPAGHFDGQVKVWRPTPDDPLYHDIRLELTGVDLRLPVSPWRAMDLRGQMFAVGSGSSTRLDFDALRGRLDHGDGKPAQLAMLGSVVTGPVVQSDLAFVVRDLELDEQLGLSLEGLGALGGGAWATLRPSGRCDLVCRHERTPGAADRLRLVVQLVDVRSDAPILPKPAEHMTGELTVADGELTFRDVRAEIDGALVQYRDGKVRSLPAPDLRTEITFTVKANGFPVDDGLANLFSGPLRQAVLDRQLAGRADIDALRLQFAIPGAGNPLPLETTLGGQLRLYDVEMSLGNGADGVRVQGISGIVALAESRVSDAGGGLGGTLRAGSLRVFGQPFETVETEFQADAERIRLDSLSSRCHGGALHGPAPGQPALLYLLPGPAAPMGRLSADLVFEKVDVYAFLDSCGWTNPPYSGTASGHFSLDHLDGSNVVAAAGSGELTIERGDLGVVPLFTAIYAQLPAPDRPRFNYLESSFRLAKGSVDFKKLNVRSNLLAANGKGTLELDGYVDIEMKLDNLLGASADPLVMPLVDLLTKNIVRFHLFGYLRDLHAEKRWVTERSPTRREIIPMPPASQRPALPDY